MIRSLNSNTSDVDATETIIDSGTITCVKFLIVLLEIQCHHKLFYAYMNVHSTASGNLMIREVIGTKMTRTSSVAPSVHQKVSRKAVSPFSFFNRKASRKLSMGKNVSVSKSGIYWTGIHSSLQEWGYNLFDPNSFIFSVCTF